MSHQIKTKEKAPDLLGLTRAPMAELVKDLKRAETLDDQGGAAPPRAEQVAGLALAESIRLIRMGTRTEIARASNELSQLLITRAGERLESEHREAYRLLSGASVALGAATPASSKGGARTVMRSWNGNAAEVVKQLLAGPEDGLPRIELREKMGIDDHSYLSHVLSDLEEAGLITRVRPGKETWVSLTPMGRSEEVRKEVTDGRLIFPFGLPGSTPETADRSELRNEPGTPLAPRLVAGSTGFPRATPEELAATAENRSTFTLCQVTNISRVDQDVDERLGDPVSSADLLLFERRSLAS